MEKFTERKMLFVPQKAVFKNDELIDLAEEGQNKIKSSKNREWVKKDYIVELLSYRIGGNYKNQVQNLNFS